MVKVKQKYIKYVVLLCLLAVCGLTYLGDYIRSKTYKVEIVYISDEEPPADSSEKVVFRVRVTRFGRPQAGHDIFASPTGGRMFNYMGKTDENGIAEFVYLPYTETVFTPARDVDVRVRDESNSLIWEVNADNRFTLHLRSKGTEK